MGMNSSLWRFSRETADSRQTSHEEGQWGLLTWSEAVSAGSPSPQKWHSSLQEASAEPQSHISLSWVLLFGRDPSAREHLSLEGRLSVSSLADVPAQLPLLWAVKPLKSRPPRSFWVPVTPLVYFCFCHLAFAVIIPAPPYTHTHIIAKKLLPLFPPRGWWLQAFYLTL